MYSITIRVMNLRPAAPSSASIVLEAGTTVSYGCRPEAKKKQGSLTQQMVTSQEDRFGWEFPITTNLETMIENVRHRESGYSVLKPERLRSYRERDYQTRDSELVKLTSFSEIAEATTKPHDVTVNNVITRHRQFQFEYRTN